MYYLTSTLESTRKITDDLHQAGIGDWFIHVLSQDEAGLKKEKIHSSNYLEQLDLLRYGILGAISGFAVGLIAAGLVNTTELFGSDIPNVAFYAIVLFFTMFGSWEGGLIGVAAENKKMALFHDDIEAGSYLIIVYIKQSAEDVLHKVMETQHPEVELAAIDVNFYNPLTSLKRI
ncbi:hypothetical protein [Methyloprofundus sp.]|uniref:hypothetical protein n=1 Tax=Methyloprofundus sp. TaxID=2020875 RepID=UPI003D142F45